MAISIVNRNYSTRTNGGGNSFLLANSQVIAIDSIDIVVDFNFSSSSNDQVMVNSENSLQLLSGVWTNKGVVIGDSHIFTGTISDGTTSFTFTGAAFVVQNVSGNVITYTTSPFPSWSIGEMMPSLNSSNLLVTSDRVTPETIEVFHNLIPNSAASGDYSLFDNEVNRFKVSGVDSMVVSDVLPMAQLGFKSGGCYFASQITRLADVGSKRSFQFRWELMSVSFEDSDFDTPYWFDAAATLKPYYRVLCLPQDNNPNSSLTLIDASYLGNYGWLGENYNQGINPFTVELVEFKNSNNELVSDIMFNDDTQVLVKILGPANFEGKVELSFNLIPDMDDVKNMPESLQELIYFSNSYVEAPSTASNVSFGLNGRTIGISDELLTVGTNEITAAFIMMPNSLFSSFVELQQILPKYRLTINVQSIGGTSNDNNNVTLIAKEGTIIQNPLLGGRYSYESAEFINHKDSVISGPGVPNYIGCTEDDFVYKSVFKLPRNEAWKSLNVAVEVYSFIDDSSFVLDSQLIPFNNYITTPNGVIQINYLQGIQQFLDAPERNKISLKLNGAETVNEYEVELIWSLMSNWRTWLSQSNAFAAFFDASLPNNGMNKEWLRYLQEPNFGLRLKCTLKNPNDVEFYWTRTITVDDYDKSVDVSSQFEFYNVLNELQTSLISGQDNTIKAIHTLNSGVWDTGNCWGWISIRPKNAESNKRISTVWDWDSQSLPLKPAVGLTKAKLTFPTPDVAVVECTVDTAMINVGEVTVVSRIEMLQEVACSSVIGWLFNEVQVLGVNDSGYTEAFISIMNGRDISNENVCCPSCVINIDSAPYEIYSISSNAAYLTLASTFDPEESPCCLDVYGVQEQCEVDFDLQITDFLTLIGATAGQIDDIEDLVPTQMNAFTGSFLADIISNITALTTDNTVRYQLFYLVFYNGIKFTCLNDVKYISKL